MRFLSVVAEVGVEKVFVFVFFVDVLCCLGDECAGCIFAVNSWRWGGGGRLVVWGAGFEVGGDGCGCD
jgi:hypothetical protein